MPQEFEFAHDFSLRMHDWMVGHIARGERDRLFDVSFQLSDEREVLETSSLQDDRLFEWLEENGYSEVIGRMYLRRVFPGLLSDFLHFVFEALSCSRKSKLAVTYALLRKPFRENLTYMEWLLADPSGLLNTLHNEDPRRLSMQEILSGDDALKRTETAVSRTAMPAMHNAQILHDIRFDKKAHFSLEEFWNKAMHLVTTKKPINTEPQNLNFIFSDDEDRQTQWYFLYSRLPMLLAYAADVSDSLMYMATEQELPDYQEQMIRRCIGLAVCSHEMNALREGVEPDDHIPVLDAVVVQQCGQCGASFDWDYRMLRELYSAEGIECGSCEQKTDFRDLVPTEQGSTPARDSRCH